MACRIGITTNPGERRQYWEGRHPNLRNWQILGRYNTRRDAQRAESRLALRYNCHAHQGGAGDEYAEWCVYKFDY